MSSQGPLYPSTVTDEPDTPWTNLANVKVDDGATASATLDPISSTTAIIYASNFGFSIPAGATINGIVVEIKRSSDTTGNIVDYIIRLLKAGLLVGSNYADTVTQHPSGLTYATYGSATDLWGTTWTVADVNASNFGIQFQNNNTGGIDTDYVDAIRITVYYTPAGATPEYGIRVQSLSKHAGPTILRNVRQLPPFPEVNLAPVTNSEFAYRIQLPHPHVGPPVLRLGWRQPQVPPVVLVPVTNQEFAYRVQLPHPHVGPPVLRLGWRQPTVPPLVLAPVTNTEYGNPGILLPNNRVGPPAMRRNFRGPRYPFDTTLSTANRIRRVICSGA